MSNTDVSINLDERSELVAVVGGNAVTSGGDQHAASIEIQDATRRTAVRLYAYGDADAGRLADALASLVGQLLATVNRDDVDPALAANIGRNLGAAASRWAGSGRAPIGRTHSRSGRPVMRADVEDGGVMGDIVRCHECGGSGELHDPHELPGPSEPQDCEADLGPVADAVAEDAQ